MRPRRPPELLCGLGRFSVPGGCPDTPVALHVRPRQNSSRLLRLHMPHDFVDAVEDARLLQTTSNSTGVPSVGRRLLHFHGYLPLSLDCRRASLRQEAFSTATGRVDSAALAVAVITPTPGISAILQLSALPRCHTPVRRSIQATSRRACRSGILD